MRLERLRFSFVSTILFVMGAPEEKSEEPKAKGDSLTADCLGDSFVSASFKVGDVIRASALPEFFGPVRVGVRPPGTYRIVSISKHSLGVEPIEEAP